MTELVFSPPAGNEQGYLRRMRTAAKHLQELDSGLSPDRIDALVTFLGQWVDKPEDPEEAKEAMLDASRDDFYRMLQSLMNPGAVPKAKVSS